MVVRAVSGSGGSGGIRTSYSLLRQVYCIGNTHFVIIKISEDGVDLIDNGSYSSQLDYSDDNISLTHSGYVVTVTLLKPATVTNKLGVETENHYNAGQSFSLLADNSALEPFVIVMD